MSSTSIPAFFAALEMPASAVMDDGMVIYDRRSAACVSLIDRDQPAAQQRPYSRVDGLWVIYRIFPRGADTQAHIVWIFRALLPFCLDDRIFYIS